MTRRPTIIDSTKMAKLIDKIDTESSSDDEKERLLAKMITMPQVEAKVNEILVMHRKALVDEITKQQTEIQTKFENLLAEKIATLNVSLSQSSIDFISKLNSTDKYIKETVKDLQFQVRENAMKITGFFDKLEGEAKRIKREKNDTILMCEAQNQKIATIELLLEEYDESLKNLGEITGTILELQNINNALDSQDEEDRQSISLWGMYDKPNRSKAKDYSRSIEHIRKPNSKEKLKLGKIQNPSGNYNVVTVDKNCYSCTNYNPAVLSAFKMACLSYYPSSINFQGKVVSRLWLHDRRSQITKNLYLNYHNLQPWKSGKCKIDKYMEFTIETDMSYLRNQKLPGYKSVTPNDTSKGIMPNNDLMRYFDRNITPLDGITSKNRTIQVSKLDLDEEKSVNEDQLNKTTNFDSLKQFKGNMGKLLGGPKHHVSRQLEISTDNLQNIKMMGRAIKTSHNSQPRSLGRSTKMYKRIQKNRVLHSNKIAKGDDSYAQPFAKVNIRKSSRNYSEDAALESEYDFKQSDRYHSTMTKRKD